VARSPTPPTTPSLDAAQVAGFPIGGEPLAVDLADTIVTVSDPPADLLADRKACERFWALQHARLPDSWQVPTLSATRELRDAIRQLLDDTLAVVRLDFRALEIVNAVSASVSTTLEASQTSTGLQRVEHWHAADPTALPLAAAARSAIEIVTDTASVERLRRCANIDCSMLFVNGDSRRQWCTPNICGNRARVARHYHRHRSTEADL
jgi:predicted RNA-binding Zn ribbon-like protein